ncbi:MAG: neutral/alkaline non-lysosomal ceramidase N-terminal domain-containing protein [Bryobacteraceae bacterium]
MVNRREFSLSLLASVAASAASKPLRVATFRSDVTPPSGTPLCFGMVPPGKEVIDRLSARGIIVAGAGDPVVLAVFDWVGIGNQGHDEFRQALAKAAGTSPSRVSVHCLHQHDAPGYDPSAHKVLREYHLALNLFDEGAMRDAIGRVSTAAREAARRLQPVTEIGLGKGQVERVASNRRVLGEDGKVKYVRLSSCRVEAARAAPEGTVDPNVRLVSFWNGSRPLASVTWYSTHPQSFYAQGGISADFVGLARALRELALPEVAHIHFNGASGNVAAGKYNDGSPENRPVLAWRLAGGMKRAWDSQARHPIQATDLDWKTVPAALPARPGFEEETLRAKLTDPKASAADQSRLSRAIAWYRRLRAGHRIELSALRLGPARVLHMPGELFIEYQLAAQQMRPAEFQAMAAYGDYGPSYIGTEIS